MSAAKPASTHYPCGKKRPNIDPNPKVVAQRQILLGLPGAKGHALQLAENALDLAYARGWLTEEMRTAAAEFATLNRRAGVEVAKLRTASLEWIARAYAVSEGDPVAHAKLRAIWMRLQPMPQVMRVLVDVCLLGEWPAWLMARIEGAEQLPEVEIERDRLVYGLKVVAVVASVEVSDDTKAMLREALSQNATTTAARRWIPEREDSDTAPS